MLSFIPQDILQNNCAQRCGGLITSTISQAQQQPRIQSAFRNPNVVMQVYYFDREPISPFTVSLTISQQYRDSYR